MSEITASLVKQLREQTGAGMMACKRALTEMGGDIEKAIDWLRKKGLAAAAKKAEEYYTTEGRKQDSDSIQVFKDAGVEIAELSDEDFAAWQKLAMETSYKKFVEETPNGQELLDMALAVK